VSISRTKHKNGREYHQLKVKVGQRDPRPLERLVAMFGGNSRTNGRGVALWEVSSSGAAAMLTALLPYLLNKREQAEVALTFQARRNTGRGRLAVQDREQDAADFETVKRLKHVY
jgi:hypothetical protein